MQRHAFAIAFTALALGTLATGCPFSAETFHKHCALPKDCDDGIECTEDKCTAGLCENPPKPKETGCGPIKASVCDGKGECVECLTNADCMANHAMKPICDTAAQKCVSCFDGVKNGKETDVDCGGPDCGACLGKQCDATHGCGNHTLCALPENVCCKTACDQKCEACTMAKTGEPDGTCAPIPYGKDPDGECTTAGGCGDAPNKCRCEDGVKNADESDVDCGGTTCQGCQGGKTCLAPADCAPTVPACVDGACCNSICMAACRACNAVGMCVDVAAGVSDPTCGAIKACGPNGAGCIGKAGASCLTGLDCLSNNCTASHVCGPGSFGAACNAGGDCASGNCQNNFCQ